MTAISTEVSASPPAPVGRALPFYYGWINLVVAALAMTATFPGRTHGLGMINKQLQADLGIGNVFHKMAMAAIRGDSEYEAIFRVVAGTSREERRGIRSFGDAQRSPAILDSIPCAISLQKPDFGRESAAFPRPTLSCLVDQETLLPS